MLFIVYRLSVKLLFKLKLIKGVQYGLIGFVVGKDQSDAILVGRTGMPETLSEDSISL